MDFEGGNDVECSIELFSRRSRGGLSVERNQMMEEIRGRKYINVQIQNVLDGGHYSALTGNVTKKIRWIRCGIRFIRMVDEGQRVTTDCIFNTMRIMLIGDGPLKKIPENSATVPMKVILTFVGFGRYDQMYTESLEQPSIASEPHGCVINVITSSSSFDKET